MTIQIMRAVVRIKRMRIRTITIIIMTREREREIERQRRQRAETERERGRQINKEPKTKGLSSYIYTGFRVCGYIAICRVLGFTGTGF